MTGEVIAAATMANDGRLLDHHEVVHLVIDGRARRGTGAAHGGGGEDGRKGNTQKNKLKLATEVVLGVGVDAMA